MKKLLFAALLSICFFAANAQRMLVLPDTPVFANQNRGVWVFRIADNLPYYSNGNRWIGFTGGLGPQTIADSLAAYNSRVVTSYNGIRGAVKGVDSLWFTNSGTLLHWRWNNLIYTQSIVGGSGTPAWGTITGSISSQTDLQAVLNLKLSISDTTGKWVTNIIRRSDSVFKVIGGVEIFVYKDSIGTGGGGGGAISSVFGRTGAVTAQSGDYASFYRPISYVPSWSEITSKPTLLVPADTVSLRNHVNKAYVRIEITADSTAAVWISLDGTVRDTIPFTAGGSGSGGTAKIDTIVNVGTGSNVFKGMNGLAAEFRRIRGATAEVVVTENTNDLTVSITRGSGTRAARPASPTYAGYEYYQTDEKIGWYKWNGSAYEFIGGGRLVARSEWISYNYPLADGGFVMTTGVSPAFGTSPTFTNEGWGWSTGTSTTGSTRWLLQSGAVSYYTGKIYCSNPVVIPTLSDGTNRFQVVVGDSVTSDNGIYFSYIDNENSGNWVCVSRRSGGGMSRTNTAVAPTTATWQQLSYLVTSSEIKYYINEVLVATHSNASNIPATGYLFHSGITKSAGSSERTIYFDYTEIRRYE